jgi:hypothetical protein
MKGFFERNKILHVIPDSGSAGVYTLGAGTTDVNTGVVDAQLHQCAGLAWVVILGTLAASSSVTIKAQHSDDGTNWSDVEGTSQATVDANDDDKILGVQVGRLTKRYNRLNIVRGDGGNSAINAVLANLYEPRVLPVAQLTSAGQFVRAPEIFDASNTGTA